MWVRVPAREVEAKEGCFVGSTRTPGSIRIAVWAQIWAQTEAENAAQGDWRPTPPDASSVLTN